MVNQQTLIGNWNEIRGKLRQQWGQLTENDLESAQGGIDQLVGVIQRKTGESRERIEQYLDQITANMGQAGESMRQYGQQAGQTAREYGQQASRQLGEKSRQAQQQLQAGYSQAERMVRERPAESLAVAFGAGVCAGLLVGMIMRPR